MNRLSGGTGEPYRPMGRLEEPQPGRAERCMRGMVVYHPPQEEHADSMGTSGARCFNLELGASFSDRLEQDRRLPLCRNALHPGRASAFGVSLKLRHEWPASITSLLVEETVLELLAKVSGWAAPSLRDASRPRWLSRTLERLEQSDPPSISELAADAGVHPVYFTRVFRAALRIPPSRYVVEARLERASALLVRSGNTLATIAHTVGYSDQSHFCRQFRRRFGITPSAYRASFS